MKKLFLFFAVLIVLLGCEGRKENTVTIGAILPLTGDAAAWGIPPRNAATLAVEQINADGGINGMKVVLVVEDGGCDPAMGVNAGNKLMTVDKPVAIVGGVCSAVTLAVAPIAQRNKTVMISPASTHPSITDVGDFVFRVIPSDALRAQVFAEYIASLGHKTAVVLAINNEAGKGAEINFTKFFEKNGGKVLGVENYMPDATTVRTQLTRIRRLQPDIILALSQVTDAVMVLKEVKELNIGIPLFFQSEALDDPSVIRNAGSAANGATYITFAESDSDIALQFQEDYRNRFNTEPAVFAAEAYDAVKIIAKLLGEIGEVDSEKLNAAIYNVRDFEGVSGVILFDENGDVIKPLDIKHIENNQIRIIKQ